MRSMVAAPDNRDLSNKEKEHTHIQHRKKKKKYDGQIKKTAKRVTGSTLPCYGAMVTFLCFDKNKFSMKRCTGAITIKIIRQ